MKTHLLALLSVASFTSATGFIHADIILHSAPVGVMTKKIPLGISGLSFPLIAGDAMTGIVESNDVASLELDVRSPDPSAALDPGRTYYAELTTGGLAGERLDIDTAATIASAGRIIALASGPASNSTLGSLAQNALTGARVVIRPHVRLADMQSMIPGGMVGSDKHNLADGVNVLEGGVYVFYHLRGNGTDWSKKDAPGEFAGMVIPPDASIQVVLRSSGRTWLSSGVVRTTAFRKNLAVGTQAFSTGFPIALSPTDLGAFAGTAPAPATDWLGNADPDLSDGLQVGTQKPASSQKFFLDGDGHTWRRVAGKVDITAEAVVPAAEAVVLRRNNPDIGYLILPPFAP